MAKLWTKDEIKHLKELIAKYGRGAEYNKDKLAYEFMEKYPARSRAGVCKKMRAFGHSKQYTIHLEPRPIESQKPWDKLQEEIERLRAKGVFGIVPPQYNPIDVAFTRPVTKTDIIRHYRDMGLRGKITLELGE